MRFNTRADEPTKYQTRSWTAAGVPGLAAQQVLWWDEESERTTLRR